MKLVTRRSVLIAATGIVVLAGGTLGVGALDCDWSEASAAGADRLFSAIPDIVDPLAIGSAYVAANSPQSIARELLARDALLAAARPDCPERRRNLAGQAFREDFRDGNIVLVEQWVISRSECLVAALWVAAGAPAPDLIMG
jgi:hypothetical protein